MFLEYLLFLIGGMAVGSFLTVVVERYDAVESFVVGRSKCNHCQKSLSWWELLPFLGYFLVGGKCLGCKKSIPRLYPFFELITGLTFVGLRAAATPLNYPILAIELLTASALLLLFFYDWMHQAFPTALLGLALGLVLITDAARCCSLFPTSMQITIHDPLFGWLASPTNRILFYGMGGVIGAGLLSLLALPSKGRWMGYGDVLLAGILGFWLGYPFVLICLVLAFYSGALIGGGLMLTGGVKKDHRIAFGPFLIFGAILTKVWGPQIFQVIMKIWGIV